jgi:BASS family bile acid:Na+ symporter
LDLATLTALLVRVFLVVTMLSIGLRLADRASLRSVPPVTAAALGVASVILVPVVGVAIAAWAGLTGAVAIAFLATTVAPAGSLGPKLVQIARGDLAVGVLATFALSVVATLTVAPSLELGARVLGLDPDVSPIDPRSVIVALAIFQLAPTIIGMAIARRRPSFASRIVRPLTSASTVLIVLIVVVAIADTYDDVLLLGPAPVLAMILLTVVANAIGWVAGGPTAAVRRASALVTAQRSPGLALLLVAGPGHGVETATVVAFTLVLLVVNGGIAVILGRPWSPTVAARRSSRAAI